MILTISSSTSWYSSRKTKVRLKRESLQTDYTEVGQTGRQAGGRQVGRQTGRRQAGGRQVGRQTGRRQAGGRQVGRQAGGRQEAGR